MPKMTDNDLLSLTQVLLSESDTYIHEEISWSRSKALRYYGGEVDRLPKIEGRSQIVVTELRDTIEWVLPDLTKIFTGGEDWVSIEPQGSEDTFQADVAEDWVNYVIMRQNNGFMNTYTWIKDALLQRNGFLVQDWQVEYVRDRKDFKGLTEEEYQSLKKDGEFIDPQTQEMVDDYVITDTHKYDVAFVMTDQGPMPVVDEEMQEQVQDQLVTDDKGNPVTMPMYDVAGYQEVEEARIVEEVYPPEQVYFTSDTVSIPHSARFIAVERQVTVSDLREMFRDIKIPDDIAGPSLTEEGIYGEEEIYRRHDTSKTWEQDDFSQLNDPATRKVWLYRIWVKCDRDGDGITEWTHLYRVGSTILSEEEVDYPNIYSICPIPWPHRPVGLSLSDLLFDLQELQTALNRQILDAVYLANNPRSEVVIGGLTEDSIPALLDNRIGGYVPVRAPGTINPLITAPLQPWTFNLLELWDQKREARTGVSRYSAGLDPNSLNKTATGVMQIMSAAARRIELIARIFAETGFKDRVRGILDLSAKYPEYVGKRVLRLTGKQIDLTAEQLRGRYDLIVNPGIGTGNKQEQLSHIMTLLQTQKELLMAGMGPGNPQSLVTMENLFNTLKALIENMGYKATGDFITDPNDQDAKREQPKQPEPSKDQLDFQLKQTELQQNGQLKAMELKAKNEESLRKYEIEKEQNALKAQELALKRDELDVKAWETGHRAATSIKGVGA